MRVKVVPGRSCLLVAGPKPLFACGWSEVEGLYRRELPGSEPEKLGPHVGNRVWRRLAWLISTSLEETLLPPQTAAPSWGTSIAILEFNDSVPLKEQTTTGGTQPTVSPEFTDELLEVS